MRGNEGLVQALAAGDRAARWGYVALLALALQAWNEWVLLRVWVITGGTGPMSLFARIRMLPAHPDWVLSALAQSVVTALVLVGVARHWRSGWALAAAAVAGGVARAATFGLLPSGLGGLMRSSGAVVMHVIQSAGDTLAAALVLATVAVAWRRLGRWAAVPVVGLAGGAAAGAAGLLLAHTIWGAAWPAEWPREMASQVIGVAMLAAAIAVLRGTTTATPDRSAARVGRRCGAALGALGLTALTAVHLLAGIVSSAWTLADSRRLVIAGVLLAALSALALFASPAARASRTRAGGTR